MFWGFVWNPNLCLLVAFPITKFFLEMVNLAREMVFLHASRDDMPARLQ